MKLKRLHLQGFTSYIDSEVTFKDNIVSTIVAPNGYGKSSILEAITTALFYKARGVDNKGAGMEDLINNSCKEFIITLEFSLNDIDYKIIRKKSKTKHELKLFIDNIEQTEKITDTQKKINDIIKMDYETFLDTVCIGQGKSGNFMSKPANERKEVIANILNLLNYELCEKKAKEDKKLLNNKLNELQVKIGLLSQNYIDENNIISTLNYYKKQDLSNDIEQAKLQYENEKQKHIQYNTLKQQQNILLQTKINIENNINSNMNKLSKLKDNYISQNTNLKQYQKKLDSIELITVNEININDINDDKTKIQDIINELQQKTSELNANINNNKKVIQDLKAQYMQLKDYDKGICQFCGNEITSTHKQQHLSKLHDDAKQISNQNKTYQTQIDTYNEQINTHKQTLIDINNQYNQLISEKQQQELKLQQQQNDIKLYNNQIQSITQTLNDIKEQKGEVESTLRTLQEELKQYDDIQIIENQTFKDDIYEKEYQNLLQQQKDIDTQITVLTNKLNDIQIAKSEIDKLQNEYDNLKLQITDYDSVIEAFGKKGIQADIIANVLPDIENEVNNILNVLFNNNVNIEFVTQKENSKGNTLETLEIVIHDKGIDRKYETYSGGEKFRIDFAFHIGLSKFLSKRANNNIEFFMIDEGLGSQDDEGKDNFITIVNQIRGMFKQIFIITHIEEIKDVFDEKIIIVKDSIKGSLIT